jgi:hypothetical protein
VAAQVTNMPEATTTAARMTEAASALVAALDTTQRSKATFALDDDAERRSWAYFPKDFHGLPLREMNGAQRKLTHLLVASGLSVHAYAQATTIIALDDVLNEVEGRRLNAVRDSGRYFVSIFGAPGGAAPWGWRFEGHHVSLHFTIADGALVSPTPIFLGANPAEVRHGERAVLRPCGEEEDLARDLLASLDAEQKRIAILGPEAPPDIVLMNLPVVPDVREFAVVPDLGRLRPVRDAFEATPQAVRDAVRFARRAPRGLGASAMHASQRSLLAALVAAYVERLPHDLAQIEQARIERAGIDAMHFAWAGEQAPRRPHYYRLQAPTFLVEYDNTQDDANHVHTVWRNPDADFGADLLRDHLRRDH